MASDLFGAENIGEATPTSADTGAIPDTLLSTSVQVPIPTEGMQLAINETTVDEALRVLKPRSTALWACYGSTDDPGRNPGPRCRLERRRLGRLSGRGVLDRQGRRRLDRDARDRARDRGVACCPSSSGSTIVLVLIAGLTALVWIRRARRRADVRPSDPAPVH